MEISANDFTIEEVEATITCDFCGEEFSHYIDMMSDDSPEEQMVEVMQDAGWEMKEDAVQIGICCPSCAEEMED